MSSENVRGLMSDLPVSTLATTGASSQVRPETTKSHTPNHSTVQTTGFATVLAQAVPNKSGTPQAGTTEEAKSANPSSTAAADADRPAPTRTTGCRRMQKEIAMAGDLSGMATSFSFCVRVSGNIGQIGRETQSRFPQAAEGVSTTRLTEAGWTSPGKHRQGLRADPVSVVLQGRESTPATDQAPFNGFLDEIRTATRSIQSQLSLFTGIPAASSPSYGSVYGYGRGAGGASSSAAPGLPGSVSTAWNIAQLRLSNMDTTGSNGSTTGSSLKAVFSRPPAHNREGLVLIKVDRQPDVPDTTPLDPAASDGHEQARIPPSRGGLTAPAMRAFLRKFLDFIESYRENLENPDMHTPLTPQEAAPSADSPTVLDPSDALPDDEPATVPA